MVWCSFFVLFACCVPVLAFSAPADSVIGAECAFNEALCDMDFDECFAEWDRVGETAGERQHLREMNAEIVQKQRPEEFISADAVAEHPNSMVKSVSGTKPKSSIGIVNFTKPKSPKDFVRRWPEQRRLFQSLSHPRTREQERELGRAYYMFVAAGRLLEELGERAFLKRFGKETVNRMIKSTIAEIKQRKAGEKDRRAAEDLVGRSVDMPVFLRPKSPADFVECWPEQKRTYERLPRPLTPEQRGALLNSYYPFRPAGRLLEELGKEAFLQRFGRGSVTAMQKAAVAENKQSKATKGNQRVGAKENKTFNIVIFVKPKTPEEFVESWSEQKRLFESLPRHKTAEQKRILDYAYYRFVAAGQLLEELGKEAFLQRFGGGFVTDMQKGAAAEIKQRKAAEKGKERTAKEPATTRREHKSGGPSAGNREKT